MSWNTVLPEITVSITMLYLKLKCSLSSHMENCQPQTLHPQTGILNQLCCCAGSRTDNQPVLDTGAVPGLGLTISQFETFMWSFLDLVPTINEYVPPTLGPQLIILSLRSSPRLAQHVLLNANWSYFSLEKA